MVNLLENGYNDLRRIGLGKEISNSTIASMVEEKLPKTIKAQWCLRMCEDDIDDTDKFPPLMEFLLKHKRAVEYGNNELRTSQKFSNNSNQLPNRTGATNFGQSSSNGSSKSPRETCWIHTDSKGNHPIWQCQDFIKMTVPDRKALVLKNKACHKCLLMKCPGVNVNGQCWLKFSCKEEGCGKEHNQLLHEDSSSNMNLERVNHTTFDSVGESYIDGIDRGAALLPTQ